MDQAVARIQDADVHDLRVEDLADPLADEVVHRLHLEVLGERPLHVRDDSELGVALLRLLEQPGVLERDAQAPGDRREQADVGLAERVFPVEVLQRDASGRLAADGERDVHGGSDGLALGHGAAELLDPLVHPLVDHEGLA